MRVIGRDYYAQDNLQEHRPGDIWWEFPACAVLPWAQSKAIVITPACDLDNAKTETITYLPVIPISQYLCSTALARSVKNVLREILGSELLAGLVPPLITDDTMVLSTPQESALRQIADATSQKLGDGKLRRIHAGLEIAAAIRSGDPLNTSEPFKTFYGKQYRKLLEGIVRNGRPDTHFLPKDSQPSDYSVMVDHSVALLRAPLSIPLELIERIDAAAAKRWKSTFKGSPNLRLSYASFSDLPPIKRGRLREAFLKDLITRYTANFSRLGSPDFSESYVSTICDELEK